MNKKTLFFDKTLGCLLGGLIGDAMGAPVEGMHYKKIAEKYGQVNDFEGSGTDDSAIKRILCDALIKYNGEITADEFFESFLSPFGREKREIFYMPVKSAIWKAEAGLTTPVNAGFGNMQSSSTAMAISPMGIVNACNPRQAAIETYDVAGFIHSGVSSFCRDGACAMAAAVAEAMRPDSTVKTVLEASTAYLHRISSREMISRIGRAVSKAKELGEYDKFREWYYDNCLEINFCDSRETVPCVLSLFYLADGDPSRAIVFGANFGRDADTIATMVGALAGAFKGVSGLKKEWIDKMSQTMPDQENLAQKLTEIAVAKAARANKCYQDLLELNK